LKKAGLGQRIEVINMLSCKETSALVSSAMDIKLPMMQRLGIWIHLIMCKYCRRYRKQLQIIRDVARRYEEILIGTTPHKRLSQEAVDRITETLIGHSH
jgi:hypothetical protein